MKSPAKKPTKREQLENMFTYHPPKEGQPEIYEKIRAAGLEFATLVLDLTPESREQSLAITHIDDAVTSANSALARNGGNI